MPKQAMRLSYNEIAKGDLLWVCFFYKSGEYNFPAIVQESNHLGVRVKYGDIESFSTKWVHHHFDQRDYSENPERFPTSFQPKTELTFPVKNVPKVGVVHPLIKNNRIELQRYPVRLFLANPYNRVHHNGSFGEFHPSVQGFADKVWEIESERPLQRFSKTVLEDYVHNHFFQTFGDPQATIKYPSLCQEMYIYTTRTEQHYIDAPVGREGVLKRFMEHCVPYLANKAWYDVIQTSGLNHINYYPILCEIHKAYLVATHLKQQGAVSFSVEDQLWENTKRILKALGLEKVSWTQDKRTIIQVKTEDLQTKLGSTQHKKTV
jgi:hypothetical protein